MESRMAFARAGGKKNRELFLNGNRVSVLQGEKQFQRWTVMTIAQLLNCALRNG